MKNEMNKMIQEVMNPKLTDVERKTLALRVAIFLLSVADFMLDIDEDGALTVFSFEGEIVLRKNGVEFVEFD